MLKKIVMQLLLDYTNDPSSYGIFEFNSNGDVIDTQKN